MSDTTPRDKLVEDLLETLCNSANFPRSAVGMLGQDMRPLAGKVADRIIAAGWRSPVRMVSTAEQAMALRDGTLVVTRMGGSGYVWKGHVHATFPSLYALEWAIEHYGPLTVVWEPEEGE